MCVSVCEVPRYKLVQKNERSQLKRAENIIDLKKKMSKRKLKSVRRFTLWMIIGNICCSHDKRMFTYNGCRFFISFFLYSSAKNVVHDSPESR